MNEEALKLTLSSSPHAHSPNSTRRIMLDVCISLLPALIGARSQPLTAASLRTTGAATSASCSSFTTLSRI